MSEIADFLRARYAERRALAEAASPGPWRANAEHDEVIADDGITVAEGFALSGRQLRATVQHIAANDPEDVIADLDAKLALVDVHGSLHRCPAYDRYGDGPRFVDPTPQQVTDCCTTLRILAQPFVGHPDHKGEEWAP